MVLNKRIFTIVFSSVLLIGCNPEPVKDPVSPLNSMVKDYGYIGFQNPMDLSGAGTMVGGTPTALSFVAHKDECFPETEIERFYDRSEFSKKYSYTFKGNLGFLSNGNSIVSAALGLTKDLTVNIELTGLTMEYMSSIDISEWYQDGMSSTCKDYLDEVGFFIQTLSSENLKISIQKIGGVSIGLSADTIAQYFQFQTGVDWSIIDNYTVEITTPKFIGYQMGQLRYRDEGRTLYRAKEVSEEGDFLFKSIGVFSDNKISGDKIMSSDMNDSSVYLD